MRKGYLVFSFLVAGSLLLHSPGVKALETPPGSALSAVGRVFIVPFFSAAQTVTFSVLDGASNPIAAAQVYVNDDLRTSNSAGQLSFVAPETDEVEIALLNAEKKKSDRRKFRRRADGIFAETELNAEEAAALLKAAPIEGKLPVQVFAPCVVSPGDNFVIVGRNFSSKAEEDRVEIDGAEARVLSASDDALLLSAPNRLKIGPIRELSVTVNGQISNIVETDIARPFFNHLKTEEDDVSPEKGKIGMNGSNVPCLISVRNFDLEAASLWSPEPLGKNNVLLTPGGDQNYVSLDVKLADPSKEPQIEISLRSELDSSIDADKVNPQLKAALCRAQIFRLERRRIAAEYRLQEVREKLKTDSPEQERLMSESQALSLRMRRISTMLLARRALFESYGGTDAQYRQALDDAAGGAMVALDLSVKPVQIIPGPGETVAITPAKRGRPLRMLEPKIRLLPPMTEEELKTAADLRNVPDNNEPVTGADGLRPSLPEDAPPVSDESRKSNAPGFDQTKASPGKAPVAKTTAKPSTKTAVSATSKSAKSSRISSKKGVKNSSRDGARSRRAGTASSTRSASSSRRARSSSSSKSSSRSGSSRRRRHR